MKCSKFSTRIQALILVVAMMLTTFSQVLVLNVFAESGVDGEKVTTEDGKIIADNYDLSDEEKQLLQSGYLIGDSHEFTKPDAEDDLISVDIDSKTVTAKKYDLWIPVSAEIIVSGNTHETVDLALNGSVYSGNYTYTGNAFAVKVNYQVSVEIDSTTQQTILMAPAALKQGLANMNAIKDADAQLLVIAEALDTLQMFVDGVAVQFGTMTINLKFDTAACAAVTELRGQKQANGGPIDLSDMVVDYDGSVKYLVNNSATMKSKLQETYEYVLAISKDLLMKDTMADTYLQNYDPSNYVLWSAMKSTISQWLAKAEAILADPWIINDAQYVDAGLSDVQYSALSLMLASIADTSKSEAAAAAVKNPLVAATTTIQYNMSMYNVTINVELRTVGDANTVVTYGTKTEIVTLAENASAAEIQTAIDDCGIVDAALTEWSSAYVDGKFDFVATTLPGTLTADFTYNITYTPKMFTVNSYDAATSGSYPYGYKFALPAYGGELNAYDYTVNGSYVPEGDIYIIKEDTTISRKLGKAYKTFTLNQLVAQNYFASDAKASAILNSGALLVGNDEINVRYPDNSAGSLITLENNVTLRANNYPSSYEGLEWVPYSYVVVNGGVPSAEKFFNGNNEVTISEPYYDYIDVIYRLTFTDIDNNTVLELANIPNVLSVEAQKQISTLNAFLGYHSTMGTLDKTKLGALNGVIDVTDGISDASRAKMKATVSALINNCVDSNNYLKIYNMLSQYKTGGLNYYYNNYEALINEINLLSTYVDALIATSEDRDALGVVAVAAGFPEVVEKLDDLDTSIKTVKANLSAPNAAINLTAGDSLDTLIKALNMSGTPAEFTSVEDLYIASENFTVAAVNKVTVSGTVVFGGKTENITPHTYTKPYTLAQGEVDAIIAEIEAIIAGFNVSDKYYTSSYDLSSVLALANQSLDSSVTLEIEYKVTPKQFTVQVEGASDQTITADNLKIELPAGTTGIRYEYAVDGVLEPAGTYEFTLEQIDRLFVGGKYFVERIETDVERENLLNFVNDLNAAVGNNSIVFALTESASGYAIVMKLDLANPQAMMGSMMDVLVVCLEYQHIGIGGNDFLYFDTETSTTKASLQAIVDTMMKSGFGTESIVNGINANGSINNMTVSGTVISDKALGNTGAEMVTTTIQIGEGGVTLPFYITMGSASSEMVRLRELLAGQLGNYLNVNLANGSANLNLTMPQKAYEAYLALLLVTENVDITDINSVNAKIAIGFVENLVAPVFNGTVSVETLTNTLGIFGYNLDLVAYSDVFDSFCAKYGSLQWVYNGKTGTITANMPIKALVAQMGVPSEYLGLIAEYETGIDITAAVSLENLGTHYEALYVDIKASGVTNKAGLATDLSSKLASLSGTSVVVLLSDINDDLVFNHTTVLDLNGFTVNGNILCNGSVTIVDSNISDTACGTVNGTISGNATAVAGKYASDVSAYLNEGYIQGTDGVVENKFFDIVKDSNGNITVELNAGVLATDAMPDIKTLLVDIAVDLLMNGYTTNKLYIEGNKVYEITLDDFVAIYTGDNRVNTLVSKIVNMVDSKYLANIVNMLIEDLTAFGDLEKAILNGTPILSYNLGVGSWDVEIEHIVDGDYITANLVTGNERQRTLNFVVVGTQDDINNLAGIMGTLDETTKITASVTGDQALNGSNFVLDWSAKGSVEINLTNPKYAVALSILVADGIGAPANADLIAGIKSYYNNGEITSLKAAFNAVTTAQALAAVKNFQKGDNYVAMIDGLGLTGVVGSDVVALEGYFDSIAKLAAAVIRRLPVTGGDRTLGSFFQADGTYSVHKYEIARDRTISLFKGYSITVELELTDVFFTFKLFDENVKPDYTELEKIIAEAKKLDQSKYTVDSWENLENALADAEAALNSISQLVVNQAVEDLRAAINALKIYIDYSVLEDAIAEADKRNEADYTSASWVAMKIAYDAAVAARTSESQDEVNKAAEDLYAALDQLVSVSTVDKTALENAIIEAEGYINIGNNGIYSSSVWNAFILAYENAVYVYDNSLDQIAINDATDDLVAAMADLIALDYSRLDDAIAKAQSLTESLYTVQSWALLEAALANAIAARTSDIQSVITAAADDLWVAINSLKFAGGVVRPNYTQLELAIAAAEGAIQNAHLYSASSIANLKTVLEFAKAARESFDQGEVNTAANALWAAYRALHILDYTDLEKAIVAAEKLLGREFDYTEDSWNAFINALNTAYVARTAVEQADIDLAAQALVDATAALEILPIDYSVLFYLIKEAESLAESDYTANSWKALVTALNVAYAAREATEQVTVNNAVVALGKAINALVKVSVDYSRLQALVDQAKTFIRVKYTVTSWRNLRIALVEAEEALAAREVQSVVDAAADALEAAIAALEERPIVSDKTGLNDAIADAEKIEGGIYTKDSWENFQKALEAAKAVAENAKATQKQVNDALDALNAAKAALVELDFSDIKSIIDEINAMNPDDYTADSWEYLMSLIEAAKALIEGTGAVTYAENIGLNQSDLEAILADIEQARNDLVNIRVLKDAIDAANAIDGKPYTVESWTELLEAIANAQAVVENASATKDDVQAVLEALENVTLVELVYNELSDAIEYVEENYVPENYTAASWANLQEIIEIAKAILNGEAPVFFTTNTGISQTHIDEAVGLINDALEELVDIRGLKAAIAHAETLVESDYIAESWVGFKTALDNANAKLDNSTKTEVANATNALIAAEGLLLVKTPDYSALNDAINAAKAIDPDKYTADSYAALQNALQVAEAALNAELQSEVNKALKDLNAAVAALVEVDPPVIPEAPNYDALNAAIQKAADYTDATKYTAETWAALQAALAEANEALNADEQSVVDAAAAALEAAIAGLEEVTIPEPELNKTALEALLASVLNKADEGYTEQTWAAFCVARENAKMALIDPTTQQAIDDAYAALEAAIAGLTKKLIYTALDVQLQAAAKMNQADYTTESWAAFKAVWDNAIKVKAEATVQTDIDSAAEALKNAIAGLEKKVDRTELNKQIVIANGLNKSEYTAETWAKLEEALALGAAALTQQEVNDATAAIKIAILGLEKIPPVVVIDYTALNKYIADAKALVSNNFTADSWGNLQVALAAAESAKVKAQTQDEVNEAADALNAAIAALVKVTAPVDVTELEIQIAKAAGLNKNNYTVDSWTAFEKVLEEAKAALEATAQVDVDTAVAMLKTAMEELKKLDLTKLNAIVEAVSKYTRHKELAELWAQMDALLARVAEVSASRDQIAVNTLVSEIDSLLAEIDDAIDALFKADDTTVEDPTQTDDSAWSHVWPVLICVGIAVVVAGVAIAVWVVIKKKRTKDTTPLVDYDADDDK